MGVKRRAKAGHYYERRRTRSGRFYTVPRRSDREESKSWIWLFFLMVALVTAPFTYLLSIPVMVLLAVAATQLI